MMVESKTNCLKVAWLVPSVEAGAYFGPIIRECSQIFEGTAFYTGQVWPNFSLDDPGASYVQVVGETKFLESTKVNDGYGQGFILASPKIVTYLNQYRPDIIVASAFSLWTLIALLLKPLYGWKIIVVYDGFSPNTSFKSAGVRTFIRILMCRAVDAFIANNHGANLYLSQILKVPKDKVHNYPYLTPDINSLLRQSDQIVMDKQLAKPVFLFVGQIINRKGIQALLDACCLLKDKSVNNYTLLIVGEGAQRQELQNFVKEKGLAEQIVWTGWVEYQKLGGYFQLADVFVFPSYEDVWGMVVLEAMAFGKPVLCSKWAGAVEMIEAGETGYAFDPYDVDTIAELMRRFIDQPELVGVMGKKSAQAVAQYSPATTAELISNLSKALTL
ncbi:glycosyltransferase family 4 protein [Nodosilinea sp. PGN35]|uniref:glycosyltransferase family 4 protein n=1 Tax=Nodosilinea sp. PGN35 TaxID=3020489 RepID=UPI0023B2F148|nr:glycosyltransferase family 4 protein [Nodosilinea sp. TSF1-S3]MDF0367318.1 glycosyltransferase family 4 protein [Nodosilinea sp. TSF1-S3]